MLQCCNSALQFAAVRRRVIVELHISKRLSRVGRYDFIEVLQQSVAAL